MKTLTSASPAPLHEAVVYPSSDGEPMGETEAHFLLMVTMIASLRNRCQKDGKVYVIGNIFLYFEEGNPAARKAPDIMVVKGVDAAIPRRSFKTWVEKAAPCVIFELTSEGTAGEDLGEKRRVYEQLGVREYFLYDPLNDYLPVQLMGYRLVGEKYQTLKPAKDGSIVSEELGLRLVPAGRNLDLFDSQTDRKLPTPEEAHELWQRLEQDLQDAKEEMDQVRQVLKQAEQRASLAEERIKKLEEENRRLRDGR